MAKDTNTARCVLRRITMMKTLEEIKEDEAQRLGRSLYASEIIQIEEDYITASYMQAAAVAFLDPPGPLTREDIKKAFESIEEERLAESLRCRQLWGKKP
jgi:hypothetical protein